MPEFIALVKCPKCQYTQKTTTVRQVVCHGCNKKYTVMPIIGVRQPKIRTRIIQVIKGDSHKEYWKEKRRRGLK